ncbi:MAG TPA: MFS transporter [Methylibium sp.]|uniref:MFS transporter n=1 Tax=Methylibium sp. TaxID=2067992 RepID=UPI002DBDFA72|nr:MFS transporter [Methylibium sp.]HEU4460625.1 MFS transporter [Methylibium sp.]
MALAPEAVTPATATIPGAGHSLASSRWALLYGNFVIGCGVMVVPGSLNDLTRSLDVSVAIGGQLITAAAIVMCLGAPLMAAAVGRIDRRRLLVLALAWYGLGHLLCALVPSYAALLPVRAATMLAAAVFTPQAAAAIGSLAPPAERGRAITFVFLGWSVASVFGLPLHSYIGEAFGWRWAFGLVALLAAIGAVWLRAVMPGGIRPPAMDLRAWKRIFTDPLLMAIVAVTAVAGSGQFTVFVYFAPYFKQVLAADATQISLMFAAFGACGFIGNVLLSRHVDRVGAGRAVAVLLVMVATTMLLWPLGTSLPLLLLVMLPWAFSFFACNSAQQARLGEAAPALAPALMALNTSGIYLGQAVGAASGGAMVGAQGASGAAAYANLHWVALGWSLVALALSLWASRQCRLRAAAA